MNYDDSKRTADQAVGSHCPKCGSPDTTKPEYSWWHDKLKFKCWRCGYVWGVTPLK